MQRPKNEVAIMINLKSLISFTLTLIFIGGAVVCAKDPMKPALVKGAQIKGNPFRVSQVINHDVENPDGVKIGTIADLIAGKDGRIDYAILAHGGLLGIGESLIPIPWKAVKSMANTDKLLVNISKKSLEKAPNFNPKEWPDYTKPDWDTEIRQYYVVQGAMKE